MILGFLCKFRPHVLNWVDQIIKCTRCGRFASDIVNSNEDCKFKNED